MNQIQYWVFGYIVGVIAGTWFGIIYRKHVNRNHIYTSKDVRDAYSQGLHDGREDKEQNKVGVYTDLSH